MVKNQVNQTSEGSETKDIFNTQQTRVFQQNSFLFSKQRSSFLPKVQKLVA